MSKLNSIIPRPKELELVENLISSKFKSEANKISEVAGYLHELGGKRIRPLLTLVCAKALGMQDVPKEILDIAAGIELIHLATLLHDDIIDKSVLRRHKESAFKKFGLTDTLLTGDFLLVRAFSLCAHLDVAIIEQTEKSCVELTEGEILEIPLNKKVHDLESSVTIARKKTAALFELATFSAAHIITNSKAVENHMSAFGLQLGVAFQIIDDILDVASSQEALGKEIGSDIKEKKPSIINVLWLETGSSLANELLTSENVANDSQVEIAIAEIKSSGVLKDARELAKNSVSDAKQSLQNALLEANQKLDSDYAKQIFALIDYTLSRIT